MNILKNFAAGILKPLLLASVEGYGAVLQPALAGILVSKGSIPQDQANALSVELVSVATAELVTLINKI